MMAVLSPKTGPTRLQRIDATFLKLASLPGTPLITGSVAVNNLSQNGVESRPIALGFAHVLCHAPFESFILATTWWQRPLSQHLDVHEL